MTTKTEAPSNYEPARQLIAIIATAVFFGALMGIPKNVLAAQQWAFLAPAVGLFVGGVAVWVPCDKFAAPSLFAGIFIGCIVSTSIALYGPLLKLDPKLPDEFFNYMVGFRRMLYSITLSRTPILRLAA